MPYNVRSLGGIGPLPRVWEAQMAESAAGDALFERTGKVSFVQVLPHALQHVLAAFAGIVTPAIIIASVCGFTPQEEAAVIQASLVLSALDIFLQQFPIKGVVGSGLPIVMGASFTFVPALKAVGLELGFEAVLGAQVIGGALVALFGLLFRRVSFLFPAPVLGTVIFVIGLSLCPVAVASMAGGEGAADFGSVTNWAVALVTFVVTFMAGNYGKGALRLGSILAGICAGFVLAAVLGMVDFSAIATASWFAPPALGAHRLVFDPAACAVVGVVAIVNAVQVMGEFAAVSSAALDTPATDSQISGGLIANGLVGMLSGFLGGVPTATFGQNVGIIAENKVVNRMVFTLAAAILLIAGLLPKCAAVLTSIPQPVIGGATIGVFATIGMNGVVMFARHGLSQRDTTLMGLSIAFGTGIERTAGALAGAGFPAWVGTVFGGSSIAVAALVAVVLNLVLPRQK